MLKTKRYFCLLLVSTLTAPLMGSVHCTEEEGKVFCRGEEDSTGFIQFRRIPGWGGNAGMILIDFCREDSWVKEGYEVKEAQDGIKYSQAIDQVLEDGTFCTQRYCTENEDSFALAISTIPIPISWSFLLNLSIGFKRHSFTVICDAVEERN